MSRDRVSGRAYRADRAYRSTYGHWLATEPGYRLNQQAALLAGQRFSTPLKNNCLRKITMGYVRTARLDYDARVPTFIAQWWRYRY